MRASAFADEPADELMSQRTSGCPDEPAVCLSDLTISSRSDVKRVLRVHIVVHVLDVVHVVGTLSIRSEVMVPAHIKGQINQV